MMLILIGKTWLTKYLFKNEEINLFLSQIVFQIRYPFAKDINILDVWISFAFPYQ